MDIRPKPTVTLEYFDEADFKHVLYCIRKIHQANKDIGTDHITIEVGNEQYHIETADHVTVEVNDKHFYIRITKDGNIIIQRVRV